MIDRVVSESEAVKDAWNVDIVGDTLEEVQGEIFNMEMEEGYTRLEFTFPAKTADNKWAVHGRAWK